MRIELMTSPLPRLILVLQKPEIIRVFTLDGTGIPIEYQYDLCEDAIALCGVAINMAIWASGNLPVPD
jgi:hypothetical protein